MAQVRQLAAIMFTDIVGYTALMGDDEKKAFELLRKNRELQEPLVNQYNGRWIKEIGDGVLASFQTVTDAVGCGVKIQQACQSIPDLKLRIGIHLGEVVFENEDVFGDGVNIASRLQALAPVGGIYISESVFRDLDNQKDLETAFVKEEILKNVKHPVKIYELKKLDYYSSLTYGEPLPEKNRQTQKSVEKSIAVLPFVNMSNDPEQEYFSDGISEEIINSLVQRAELRVVGRTSSFSFKGKNDDLRTIGNKLSVANILERSIRKAGNRVRITAQLIEVSTGFHLWSQKFDRELTDIFDVQDEISKSIVDQMMDEFTKRESHSTPKTQTRNIDAYNLYLKGRFYWSKRVGEDLKKSIQFYEEAINKDADYALAYAAMSDSYSLLCAYHTLSPDDSILKAKKIAQKAVSLDPALAEAYEAIGHVEMLYEWNWNKAKHYYEQAIQLNPGFATAHQRYGILLALFGRIEEALKSSMEALRLEPLSLIINTDVAIIYFIEKRYQQAIEKSLAVIDVDPKFGVALFIAGLSYEQLGNYDLAIEYLRRAWQAAYNNIGLGSLIHVLAKAGKEEESLTLFEELKQKAENVYISPYTFAIAHLGFNDIPTAMDLMEKAVETHSVWLVHLHMKSDPRLDPLRKEKRFQDLLVKMGL